MEITTECPVREITLCGIRLQLGKDISDSNQEHPAHGDNRLLIPTASLDSEAAFPIFEALVRFDDSIDELDYHHHT